MFSQHARETSRGLPANGSHGKADPAEIGRYLASPQCDLKQALGLIAELGKLAPNDAAALSALQTAFCSKLPGEGAGEDGVRSEGGGFRRDALLEAFRNIPSSAPFLLGLADSPALSTEVRSSALEGLRMLQATHTKGAHDAIFACLVAPEPMVRQAACKALLWPAGNRASAPTILQVLDRLSPEQVLSLTDYAVTHMRSDARETSKGNFEVIEEATRFVHDPLFSAIVRHADPRPLDRVRAIIRGESPGSRAEACSCLLRSERYTDMRLIADAFGQDITCRNGLIETPLDLPYLSRSVAEPVRNAAAAALHESSEASRETHAACIRIILAGEPKPYLYNLCWSFRHSGLTAALVSADYLERVRYERDVGQAALHHFENWSGGWREKYAAVRRWLPFLPPTSAPQLHDQDHEARLRLAAVSLLDTRSDEGRGVLYRLLDAGSSAEQWRAACRLGGGDPRVCKFLASSPALDDYVALYSDDRSFAREARLLRSARTGAVDDSLVRVCAQQPCVLERMGALFTARIIGRAHAETPHRLLDLLKSSHRVQPSAVPEGVSAAARQDQVIDVLVFGTLERVATQYHRVSLDDYRRLERSLQQAELSEEQRSRGMRILGNLRP